MSDAYSTTGEQAMDDFETIRCRVCNPSGVPVVVYPWKGSPIILKPNPMPTSQMFRIVQGTRITIKSIGWQSIHVRLFGDPAADLGGILNNLDLAITPDMSLDLIAQDLVQITVTGVVSRYDPDKEVRCGDG